ncbi:hypothetical protein Glove_318g39 [Diversispora epigaea]|uniref:Serine-threonine/tyrosine-protein kinase catalytic domain-containing protein n=1 Tax=Diversispora epigaea TaxID=1348612 RepID=A0A397HTJ6_9GLOM|nr:hypothetical protein Glove_318g39 [Diversispora epigaea]
MPSCSGCNRFSYKSWYKPCYSKYFQNDFNKWTSENDKIDKFIQAAQLNSNAYWEVIEWIPYDRFKDVKQIEDGNLREYLKINLNNIHKLEVLSGGEEYTKAADVYSFGIIAYEIVTGFPPYPDIPHDKDLAMKICKRGKKDSETVIQIKKAEEFSANQESTNTKTATPLNYQTHPQAIYTSRLLNYSNLSNPRMKKISKEILKN